MTLHIEAEKYIGSSKSPGLRLYDADSERFLKVIQLQVVRSHRNWLARHKFPRFEKQNHVVWSALRCRRGCEKNLA